jgi:hypothetical protein
MAKKGTKKQALNWVPSSFDEADLKKAKKEGFLSESVAVIFPRDEAVPTPPAGYRVMFLAFLLHGYLSLLTNSFVGFSLSMACSCISSRQILFFTSPVLSLSMNHSWALTHTGFFGNSSFAFVPVFL